jgi:hypothetical protein
MTKEEILRNFGGRKALHFVDAQSDGSLQVPVDSIEHLHDDEIIIGMLNCRGIGWMTVKDVRQRGIAVNTPPSGLV